MIYIRGAYEIYKGVGPLANAKAREAGTIELSDKYRTEKLILYCERLTLIWESPQPANASHR